MSLLADGSDGASILMQTDDETLQPTTFDSVPPIFIANQENSTIIQNHDLNGALIGTDSTYNNSNLQANNSFLTNHNELLPIPAIKSDSKHANDADTQEFDERLELASGLESDASFGDSSFVSGASSNLNFDDQSMDSFSSYKKKQTNMMSMDSGNFDNDMMQSGAVQFFSGTNLLASQNFDSSLLASGSNYQVTEMPAFDSVLTSSLVPSTFSMNDSDETELPPKCCEYCSRPIEGEYRIIGGRFYHASCLKCSYCAVELPESKELDLYKGKLICSECMSKIGKRTCEACRNPIIKDSECVTLQCGHMYHSDCLSCYICSTKLDKDSFVEVDNAVLCKSCKQSGKRMCRKCGKFILDDDIVFHNQQYFHKEHFCCEICNEVLKGMNFVVHHNKFYCKQHGSVYEESCATCKNRLIGASDRIKWHNKYYHPNCLICRVCGSCLTPDQAHCIHGRPHCIECFQQRVLDGDCDKEGKSTSKKAKHDPDELMKRRNEKKELMQTSIRYPRYRRNDEVPLEPVPSIKGNSIPIPNIDDLTKYV